MSATCIVATALTTFDVAPDGKSVRLNVRDTSDSPAALVLPTSVLTQLLMTLPRMVQSALRKQFADDTMRLVHPLAGIRLESGQIDAAGAAQYILTLETHDGFSVAFSAAMPALSRVAEALSFVPDEAVLDRRLLS